MKRVLIFTFITLLMIGLSAFTVSGASKDVTEEILSSGSVGDPFDFEGAGYDESLPSKLDLRDRGVISPVKLQNPFGTCWGFAAIAAAEGSILSETGQTYDETKLDLSERHLAWFALGHITDKSNSQYGEGHWLENPEDEDSKYKRLDEGGEGYFATSLFASGAGPVYETDVPYRNEEGLITWTKTNPDGSAFKDGDGKTVTKDSRTNPDEDLTDKYTYRRSNWTETADWSVSEDKKFIQRYELEESYFLPSPAGKDEKGNYEYNPDGTAAIKEQLVEGNPVQIAFLADTSKPGQDETGIYLNGKTWAHYTYEMKNPNHAVCVVGYDDSYSKSNFIDGHQPPGDGAFLVKNSWGSQNNEFPNYKKWGIKDVDGLNSGYFWISYYDKSLTRPETLNFYTGDEKEKNSHTIVDSYSFMPVYTVGNFTVEKTARMYNVFTAREKQTLKAVSSETATPGSEVTYRVYRLGKKTYSTEGLEPVSVVKDTFRYGGFHRTDLTESVTLKKGERYAVEVEIIVPSGEHEVLFSEAYSEKGIGRSGDEGYTKGIVNEGESRIVYNGMNLDLTDILDELEEYDKGLYTYDNFAIRAYSDSVPKAEKPDKVKIKSLKAGKKCAVVRWNRAKNAEGYILAYRLTAAKSWKVRNVTAAEASKLTKKVKGLKSGRKYVFRMQAYAGSGDDMVYGAWSDVKKVKIK